MVNYSAKAAGALAFLKAPLNDVVVFVEDGSRADVWLAIVRQCLPPNVQVRSVTPLGGRAAVVDACKNDQGVGPRRLYIIDGDFDFLLDQRKPKLRHLYRIQAFCQESLYVGVDQVRELARIFRPQEDSDIIGVEFDLYMNRTWGQPLRRLFALYACSFKLGGSENTCSYHVSRLRRTGTRPPNPCRNLFRSRIRAISANLRSLVSIDVLRSCFSTVRRRGANLPLQKSVSGKTHLLPLLSRWIHYRLGLNMSDHQLSLLLISNSPVPIDPLLARRFRSIFA